MRVGFLSLTLVVCLVVLFENYVLLVGKMLLIRGK